MFADNKFRFSLQWGNDTAEKIQAGKLLERLGNRKSEFIVMAVSEYLRSHPDVAHAGGKIRIEIQPTQTQEQLRGIVEEMARAALDSMIAGGQLITPDAKQVKEGPTQEELADMLANLDAFK